MNKNILVIAVLFMLISQNYSQQTKENFRHWNLSVSGGITRYFSSSIHEPDTTKNEFNMDINYLEYRIGYRINKNHEINFALRKMANYIHFLHIYTSNDTNIISGGNIVEGDILKSIFVWSLGYRFSLPQKNNNEFYFGIDLGGFTPYGDESIFFNLESGLKILIYKDLFFEQSLNFSSFTRTNHLFKKLFSSQIRLDLGIGIKL